MKAKKTARAKARPAKTASQPAKTVAQPAKAVARLTKAKKSGPGATATGNHVSVRMYNVGFGDCFLLTFPAPDRPRKVLIDCGFHAAGPPPGPIREVVDAVLADATEAGGPRIDVVICSHRHRDHVFGFDATEAWKPLRVDEVWMPWTEHPTDPEARRIREAQAKKATRLALAIGQLTGLDAAERESILEIVRNNDLTNSEAMETLHRGFSGPRKKHFLPEHEEGKDVRRLATPALPGVTVHVLGPSRVPSIIRDMDPPKEESFLRAAEAAGKGAGVAPAPFLLRWALSPTGEAFDRWFGEVAKMGSEMDDVARRPDDADFLAYWVRSVGLRGRDLQAVDRAADDDPLAAAVALDKAVNGTSLMLMFEIGGAFLLFPGDAQWGTWKRALEDVEWRELLGRTTFYKVGHHGSHNATPVQFVNDVLGTRFQAMVSTKATKKFDDIPRRPLLDELTLRSKLGIVRSDADTVGRPFARVSPLCIEAKVPF
jgi:beta-lactamase superfamily II metal-dependent hydrolase